MATLRREASTHAPKVMSRSLKHHYVTLLLVRLSCSRASTHTSLKAQVVTFRALSVHRPCWSASGPQQCMTPQQACQQGRCAHASEGAAAQVGAPGLGKTCFIRNVVAGIPGAAGGRAQLGDLAAPPARTRLGLFQSAPEALATRFDVGAAADANAVYHFCFQARQPGRAERLPPRLEPGRMRARVWVRSHVGAACFCWASDYATMGCSAPRRPGECAGEPLCAAQPGRSLSPGAWVLLGQQRR